MLTSISFPFVSWTWSFLDLLFPFCDRLPSILINAGHSLDLGALQVLAFSLPHYRNLDKASNRAAPLSNLPSFLLRFLKILLISKQNLHYAYLSQDWGGTEAQRGVDPCSIVGNARGYQTGSPMDVGYDWQTRVDICNSPDYSCYYWCWANCYGMGWDTWTRCWVHADAFDVFFFSLRSSSFGMNLFQHIWNFFFFSLVYRVNSRSVCSIILHELCCDVQHSKHRLNSARSVDETIQSPLSGILQATRVMKLSSRHEGTFVFSPFKELPNSSWYAPTFSSAKQSSFLLRDQGELGSLQPK